MTVDPSIHDPVRTEPLPPARRGLELLRRAATTPSDNKAKPGVPTVGVHWAVIVVALSAAIWFVLAMVVLYASGVTGSDYLLWIVAGFALGFFALTVGLARWAADDPRWARGGHPPLSDFVEDNVATATGVIAARQAMIQLLTLPIALAIGATVIGIVFLAVA